MSESNKFTPGPWITESSDSNGIACVATADNLLEICEVWGSSENGISVDDESMANATLIAAAPDLLEALEKALDALAHCRADIGYSSMQTRAAHMADKAIKKARGQQ